MLTMWMFRHKDVDDVRELVRELLKEAAVRVLAAVAEEDASSSPILELESSRESTS